MVTDKTQKLGDKTPTPEDATLKGNEVTPASKEPSPKKPLTYTEEEVGRLLQLDRMKAGRDWKALETERDTLKSHITAKETEIEDIQTERESLQKQIDDLASGDPDKFNLVKKDKELRERERKYKADLQALEVDKRAHGERLTRAEAIERDVLILEIAEEYENADAEKLTNLCETLGAKTEEQIKKIAETLWAKKEGAPESPLMKPDSGVTRGGSFNWRELSPDEKVKYALEHSKK